MVAKTHECVSCRRNAVHARLFCRAHWRLLPDDLRERVKWARSFGEAEDIDYAVAACLEALR